MFLALKERGAFEPVPASYTRAFRPIPTHRRELIYAAIASHLTIAIFQHPAAVITGSSVPLAEAFHSTADSGNESLLLFGDKTERAAA